MEPSLVIPPARLQGCWSETLSFDAVTLEAGDTLFEGPAILPPDHTNKTRGSPTFEIFPLGQGWGVGQ